MKKNHFWGLQGASNAIYSDRGCMVAKRVNRAALEIRKIDRIQWFLSTILSIIFRSIFFCAVKSIGIKQHTPFILETSNNLPWKHYTNTAMPMNIVLPNPLVAQKISLKLSKHQNQASPFLELRGCQLEGIFYYLVSNFMEMFWLFSK